MAQDALLGSSRWKDRYSQQGLESPPVHWESVTPHAVNQLSRVCRVIYCGISGDLEVLRGHCRQASTVAPRLR